MAAVTQKHGVNDWRYAKQQAAAYRMLDEARLGHKSTGKQSNGFSRLVANRVKWCPRSGLWRDTLTAREGQGVGSMIKFIQKQQEKSASHD